MEVKNIFKSLINNYYEKYQDSKDYQKLNSPTINDSF